MTRMIYSSSREAPLVGIPNMEFEASLLGMRATAIPPGEIDAALVFKRHFIDINGLPTTCLLSVGGSKRRRIHIPSFAMATMPVGSDVSLHAVNEGWCITLEIEPRKLETLAAERHDGADVDMAFKSYRPSPVLPHLTHALLGHLQTPTYNPLYLEGLCLAVLAIATTPELGHLNALQPSARGTDRRIDRAIDYVEAHLGEPVSVADLASVAAMSPSWFAACFKARTGRPVHAYVLERRLERARTMIAGSNIPLANIAQSCGFSDQAHMSRAFRTRFGITPSECR